ncbi:MAG TPA: putative quinol monooxygenase [Terriglobia bacterium]|nr:putative quinol monooxygenase [Terriglobia bacterium]
MYGLIAKLVIAPGKREAMIKLLEGSAAAIPGCLSYVIAEDAADEKILWVTEVWESKASHDASLVLPSVKKAVPQGKAMVMRFERVAETIPVWGVGLPVARARSTQ